MVAVHAEDCDAIRYTSAHKDVIWPIVDLSEWYQNYKIFSKNVTAHRAMLNTYRKSGCEDRGKFSDNMVEGLLRPKLKQEEEGC